MKSLANDLLTIARGVLKDVQVAYPEYGGVVKDIDRLTLMVKTRGLGCFTLDLPCLDSLLTKGLEQGRLSLQGPVSTPVSKRIQVPRLFSGLWLRVFQPNSCLREDPDITAIFLLRQLCCLGKKIEVGCSEARLNATLMEYHNVEKETLRPTLAWDKDNLDPGGTAADLHFGDLLCSHHWFGTDVNRDGDLSPVSFEYESDRALLRQLQLNADAVAEALGHFDPVKFSELIHQDGKGIGFRHGPGAVADRKGSFHKYRFINWPAKLHRVFPFETCGNTAGSFEQRPKNHELSSQLIVVPKTTKAPRLIACEPTEHQWCQQLTRRFIEERLEGLFGDNFISFRDQGASQRMALSASLTGGLATVDLSSASDRLSCYAVERMFRRNPSVLFALHASRTRTLFDGVSPIEDRTILLRKFATQGTAVTFPVQTLVFLVCALTASGMRCQDGDSERIACNKQYRSHITARYAHQVRVFGDDIIIPKHGYAKLVRLLTLLGLKVNMEKSFHKGFFREACGMDAYKGHCVTPVRPRSLSFDGPESRNALLDFSNNLFKKGLWNACASVDSIAGRHPFWRTLPVVGRDSGVIGKTSFVGSYDRHLRRRWNVPLQREEVRAWTFRSSARRKPTNDYPGLLQYFAEHPSPLTKWEHGIQGKARTSDGTRWEVPLYG